MEGISCTLHTNSLTPLHRHNKRTKLFGKKLHCQLVTPQRIRDFLTMRYINSLLLTYLHGCMSRFEPCLGLSSQPSWQYLNIWINKQYVRDWTHVRRAARLAVSRQWKVTVQSPVTVTRAALNTVACWQWAERQLERERRLESTDKRRRVEHVLGCCGGRPLGISSVVNV